MLTQLRENITGWLAYAIVILLAIPFALWGIQSYFTGSSTTVLEVGDKEISLEQFNNEVLSQKRSLEERGIEIFDEMEVIQSSISRLASLSLIDSAIEKYGYRVSDKRVAQELLSIPEFSNENGRFDQEKYSAYLRNLQISRVNYEENIRSQIKRIQFNRQAEISEFVLPEEQNDYSNLINELRAVDYLLIDTRHYVESQSVDDEELKKDYDDNLDRYKSEPKIRFRYAEIKFSDFQDDKEINIIEEEDLEAYYEENQDRFFEPEMRQVRHILFNSDLHTPEEIEKRIGEVETAIAQGTDFVKLVQQYSDDFLTSEQGGELPALSEFDIENDAMRETIFSMTEGQTSSPLRTDFGTQIFQLVQVTPEVNYPIEEVRDDIYEAIRNERIRDQYTSLIEDLTEIAETAQAEMFEEFNNYDIASTVTEWLGVFGEESILQYPQVKQVLFDEVAKGNAVSSGPIEIAEGLHTIFFVVEDFEQSRQLDFDEVKDDIRSKLLLVKAFRVSEEQAKEWLEALRKDEQSFDDLANDNEWIEKKSLDYVRRIDLSDTPEKSIINTAFTLPKVENKPSYGIGNIEENIVLIQVSDSKQQLAEDNESILSFSLREGQAIIKSLEEEFPIDLHQENIPQLKEISE